MSDSLVFKIKPTNYSNTIQLKYLGNIANGDNLADEEMELEDTDNEIKITDANGYNIVGKVYKCNLTGEYMKNKKIPVMYMSVLYTKSIISGCLAYMHLNFEMDDDSHRRLFETKTLDRVDFTGKYTITVESDDNLIQELDQEMLDLMGAQELEQFKTFGVVINKYFRPLCENQLFKKICEIGVDLREKERMEQSAEIYNYSVESRRIISLKQIKENPEVLDQMM